VNAGKSSLLNAMLGRNRAIVTSVPGTTRDYLEEGLNLSGLPVRLVDTAGLRQTQDEVERAGLEQGEDLVRSADLVCLVFDRSQELDREVRELALGLGPHKLLAVSNKQDLPQAQGAPEDWFAEQGLAWVGVSASTGQGMDRLVQAAGSTGSSDAIPGRGLSGSGFRPANGPRSHFRAGSGEQTRRDYR
jgi:tRNA modification GTPase